MIRAASLAIVLALTLPAVAQVTGSLPPTPMPTLKRAVTVSNDLVRIGDVVENAGAVANVAIFRAPDIGTTGAVSTAKVIEAIRPYALTIIETGDIAEVRVTRAGRLITAKEIEERIARSFAGRYRLGEAKAFVITLDRDIQPIAVGPSVNGDLQMVQSSFDPRSGRFEIMFNLPGNAGVGALPLRYTGSLVEMVEVVVLMRAVNRGDVVRTSDVTIERRPKAEVTGETIVEAEQAIGLVARRPLRAQQVLRQTDLTKPDAVRRDDSVVLVYEVPGILLTLRGKAQESGAEGDVINVLNVQTKRPVQGIVSGPGRVTIAAPNLTPRTIALATPERGRLPTE